MLKRNNYGMIFDQRNWNENEPENLLYTDAKNLIKKAIDKKLIPAAYNYISFDRKSRADGSALHHEIFDFNKNCIVICLREAEGNKYGVKTISKKYVLIQSFRRQISRIDLTIPIAKYAKMEILHFGDICDIAQGKKKITLMNANHKIYTGYKAVRKDDETGNYFSVWDNSEWKIGAMRVEKAQDNHSGGLYYYRDIKSLNNAIKNNDIFGDDKNHRKLTILKVEASGCHVEYGHKFAATRITPIMEVGMTI